MQPLFLLPLLLVQEVRPAGIDLPDAPPLFQLAPLSPKEVEAAKARAASSSAMLAGTHREVPVLLKKGKWQKLADGKRWTWRVRLQSTGASAMRIHLAEVKAGTVWAYEPIPKRPAVEGPFTQGDQWTGLLPGDTAVIEYVAADGKKSSKPGLVIDRISHQFGGH